MRNWKKEEANGEDNEREKSLVGKEGEKYKHKGNLTERKMKEWDYK